MVCTADPSVTKGNRSKGLLNDQKMTILILINKGLLRKPSLENYIYPPFLKHTEQLKSERESDWEDDSELQAEAAEGGDMHMLGKVYLPSA